MSEAKRVPQFAAAFLAAGLAFSSGIAFGWANIMQLKVDDGKFGYNISKDEFVWANLILLFGAVLACIPTGYLMDGVGRRLSAILMVIPYLMGWFLILLATSSWILIVGRLILGMAAGGSCVIIPVYIGEISQKDIRGILGCFFQLQITAGMLFILLIGAFSNLLLTNILCIMVAVIYAITMVFMPETPQYLIKRGETERAQKSFAWLRGKDYDAKAEMDDAKADIEAAKQEKTSFFAGFKNRACLRALYISLGLLVLQQLSGINMVLFYFEFFIHTSCKWDSKYAIIFVGFVLFVSTLVPIPIVDKLGRKLLLMISAGVMALSTLVLGIFLLMEGIDESLVKNIHWMPHATLCIFIIMFSFGFGPVPWVVLGELFPPEVKGPAGSLACLFNFLSILLVVKMFPILQELIGPAQSFWTLSLLSIIALVFVLFFVPETKNKSLSEIQEILKGPK